MAPLSGQPLIPVFIRGACAKRGGHENVALKGRSIFISLKIRREGKEACKYGSRDADGASSSARKGSLCGDRRMVGGAQLCTLTGSNWSHAPFYTDV